MRNGKKRAADDEVALMSEIASALGVHRTTAYHMARAGEIAGVSWRGGRYEMSRADFRRLKPIAKPQPETASR